jgi:hypothetical protein
VTQGEGSLDTAETRVAVASGPLVGPVLRRVVGMLAARADLPLDRLDDAVLIADVIASRAPSHTVEEAVEVALRSGERILELRIGPLREGGGRGLVTDAAVPGMGNVIEQLADEVQVDEAGDVEFLRMRLRYEG